jgi:hypothetical protein
VRELLKPRFAHRAPNAAPDRVPEVIPEKRVEPEIALTTPSAAMSVNLNKPKDVVGTSQPLELKLLERTEIPNTPSQRSSQFDSSIPEHSLEKLPNARVYQQDTSTQDDEDALALDDLSHTQNQVPFTALCSGCRKQTALVKAGEKDAQWYVGTCFIPDKSDRCIVPVVAQNYVLQKRADKRYLRLRMSTPLVVMHHSDQRARQI